jgi:linoleoyl-CoA desaturase
MTATPKSLPPLRFQPANTTPFAQALKSAAQDWLQSQSEHRYANWGMALKAVFLTTLAGCAYAAVLHASHFWGLLLAFMAFSALSMALAMNVLHDAAHEALFRRASWNRWARRLVSIPVGVDSDYWTLRHVQIHHTWANVDGFDLDIEPNPFLRQTPYQAWAPQYQHQHRYWPVIAALSLPYLCWYSDWADRFGLTKVGRPARLQGVLAWALFMVSKMAHAGLMLVLPAVILARQGTDLGWASVLGAYTVGQLLASCFLVAMILGTHWAEVAFFRPEPGQLRLPHTWYEHSFLTACDWLPRPSWLGYWLGGLNHHLTHHLFPTWSHRHYPDLANVVERVAHAHGLTYRALRYGELHAAQQRFLRAMGERPGAPNAPNAPSTPAKPMTPL